MLKLLFRISVLLFAFHVGILLNCLHIFKNYRSIPYALFLLFLRVFPLLSHYTLLCIAITCITMYIIFAFVTQ